VNMTYKSRRRNIRRRTTSSTLVVTFVLGIGIGFTLGYAFFGTGQPDTIDIATTPEAPSLPPAEPDAPPAPPETTEQEDPPPVEAVELLEEGEAEAPLQVDRGDRWPARHLFVGIQGADLDGPTEALLREFKPAGVILRPENMIDAAQTRRLVRRIKEAAGLGPSLEDMPLIAVAQEGGEVNPFGLEDAPSAAQLGARRDIPRLKAEAQRIAEAALERDIGIVLAPVLDVYRPGISGETLKDRCFGETPADVTELGLAFMEGLIEGGVVPVVKHYPNLGAARQDQNGLRIPPAEVRELAELMFPFAEAAARKAPGMLVSHIAVPDLDKESPNRPASLSPWLIGRLLRGQWAYGSVVLADDLGDPVLGPALPPETAAVAALAAGCDAFIVYDAQQEIIERICLAILENTMSGALDPDRLAESEMRLMIWQMRLAETADTLPQPEPLPLELPPPPIEINIEDTVPEIIEAHEAESESIVWEPAPDAETAPEETATEEAEGEEIEEEEAEAEDSVSEETTEAAATNEPVPQPLQTKAIRHLIQPGETLAAIALHYGVRVDDLMAWNALHDSVIKHGTRLNVYVPLAEETPAPSETAPPFRPAPVETPAPEEVQAPETTPAPPDTTPDQAYQIHTVGAGDTLYKIARQYGTSPEELIRMNNIKNPNVIPLGSRLKVPKQY
jgi:beta-N-acetylhexosaminidase